MAKTAQEAKKDAATTYTPMTSGEFLFAGVVLPLGMGATALASVCFAVGLS